MGATLLVADARQTYTLTDRGTYLAFKDKLSLVPLVEGDPRLLNIYHAYVVNPGKHPASGSGRRGPSSNLWWRRPPSN